MPEAANPTPKTVNLHRGRGGDAQTTRPETQNPKFACWLHRCISRNQKHTRVHVCRVCFDLGSRSNSGRRRETRLRWSELVGRTRRLRKRWSERSAQARRKTSVPQAGAAFEARDASRPCRRSSRNPRSRRSTRSRTWGLVPRRGCQELSRDQSWKSWNARGPYGICVGSIWARQPRAMGARGRNRTGRVT